MIENLAEAMQRIDSLHAAIVELVKDRSGLFKVNIALRAENEIALSDIATLEQENRQMRARNERLEKDIEMLRDGIGIYLDSYDSKVLREALAATEPNIPTLGVGFVVYEPKGELQKKAVTTELKGD